MRDLKFKVWIPYSKIMMQPKDIITIHESILNGVTIGQMKKWVYLQFTGLKDKNGIEIYEGDIVNYAVKKMICPVCSKKEITSELKYQSSMFCPSCGTKTEDIDFITAAEVVYHEAAFGYQHYRTKDTYQFWPTYANEFYIAWVEIIGNIYEHPGLTPPLLEAGKAEN